jgi:hypothetical protein
MAFEERERERREQWRIQEFHIRNAEEDKRSRAALKPLVRLGKKNLAGVQEMEPP